MSCQKIINYGFSIYTMILPAILGEVAHAVASTLPQNLRVTGPVWNYLDAGCSGIVGIQMMLDKENHRQTATKIKGAINFANFLQLTTLTFVNFSLLGGFGFAAAFGIGFGLSLDETVRSYRRLHNFEYWLKDSIDEMKHSYNREVELKNKITAFEKILQENEKARNLSATQWTLRRMRKRLEELEKTHQRLEEEITARILFRKKQSLLLKNNFNIETLLKPHLFEKTSMSADLHENNDHNDEDIIAEKQSHSPDEFLNKLIALDTCHDEASIKASLSSSKQAEIYDTCMAREKNIQAAAEEKLQDAIKDNIFWGFAFVGMLLCCFPATHALGLLIVGIASVFYIMKNFDRLKSTAINIYHFFSKKEHFVEEKNASAPIFNDLNFTQPNVFPSMTLYKK